MKTDNSRHHRPMSVPIGMPVEEAIRLLRATGAILDIGY